MRKENIIEFMSFACALDKHEADHWLKKTIIYFVSEYGFYNIYSKGSWLKMLINDNIICNWVVERLNSFFNDKSSSLLNNAGRKNTRVQLWHCLY